MRFALFFFAFLMVVGGCGDSKKDESGHPFDTQTQMVFLNQCSAVSDPVKQRNTDYVMAKRKLCTCALARIESTMAFSEYEQLVLSDRLMKEPRVEEAFDGCGAAQVQERFGTSIQKECLKQLTSAEMADELKEQLCDCVSKKTEERIAVKEFKDNGQVWGILLENIQACGQELSGSEEQSP